MMTLFITLSGDKTQGATGQVDTSARRQVLEGFGGANVWSGNGNNALSTNNDFLDLLFSKQTGLGVQIVRLRDTYTYEPTYITNSATFINRARARTGRPLKILMSSWSPQASLKSNGATSGGNGSNATLAKDANDANNPPYNYAYDRYAKWWYDSVMDYNSRGVKIDYASMQNEPDYDATWDSCRFNATESSTVAGYNKAFDALYKKMNTIPASIRPKLLSPETATLNNAGSYIDQLDDTQLSNLYGYNHHLYDFKSVWPDNAIPLMTSFGANYNDKPIMQTEFSKQWTVYEDGNIPAVSNNNVTTFNDAMVLALFMHNSLAVEGVSSYIYYELTYGSPQGLVTIIGSPASSWTINPVYYAFKHYSAFTDPNWQRIDASTDNSTDLRISAYISPDNNQMSIVIINKSANNDVNLTFSSLGNFEVTDGNIYRTNSTLTQKCAVIGAFDANIMALTIPKSSFTTIALNGALFVPPANCSEVQSMGYRLSADLNSDCSVNFDDLLVITSHWLETAPITVSPPEHSPDIHTDTDNIVNLRDFADLAAQWLTCNVPQQAGCISNWEN